MVRGSELIAKDHSFNDVPVNKDDFSFSENSNKINFDCALIIIHGDPGENGILQAYFDMVGIPYTTGGFFASALTFNK